jgi:hypothetical protein
LNVNVFRDPLPEFGLTETSTGGRLGLIVIAAIAYLVGSAMLVALTFTVSGDVTSRGVRYVTVSPLAVRVPRPAGERLHVTPCPPSPVTVAVICFSHPSTNCADGGETATVTTSGGGFTVTVAVAHFEESAWLVALTVAVMGDEMPVGPV